MTRVNKNFKTIILESASNEIWWKTLGHSSKKTLLIHLDFYRKYDYDVDYVRKQILIYSLFDAYFLHFSRGIKLRVENFEPSKVDYFEMQNFEHLTIHRQGLKEIKFIHKLIKLKDLFLKEVKIKDLNDLKFNVSLTTLTVAGYNLTSLSGIQNLNNLQNLTIQHTQINSLQPVTSLYSLKNLNIFYQFGQLDLTMLPDLYLLKVNKSSFLIKEASSAISKEYYSWWESKNFKSAQPNYILTKDEVNRFFNFEVNTLCKQNLEHYFNGKYLIEIKNFMQWEIRKSLKVHYLKKLDS